MATTKLNVALWLPSAPPGCSTRGWGRKCRRASSGPRLEEQLRVGPVCWAPDLHVMLGGPGTDPADRQGVAVGVGVLRPRSGAYCRSYRWRSPAEVEQGVGDRRSILGQHLAGMVNTVPACPPEERGDLRGIGLEVRALRLGNGQDCWANTRARLMPRWQRQATPSPKPSSLRCWRPWVGCDGYWLAGSSEALLVGGSGRRGLPMASLCPRNLGAI